jgi:hypothetical protein
MAVNIAVGGYALAAIGCAMLARRSAAWALIAATLLVLGLNRHFGLTARLTAVVRRRARQGGWYWPFRRPIQVVLLLLICAGLFWALRSIVPIIRHGGHAAELAAIGTAYLICFWIGRTVSLHEIDQLLYRRRKWLGNQRLNHTVEFIGLLIVLAALIVSLVR